MRLITALLLGLAARPAAAQQVWTASGCCTVSCPGAGTASGCGSEQFSSQTACNARLAQGLAICSDYAGACTPVGFSVTWTCTCTSGCGSGGGSSTGDGDGFGGFGSDGSPSVLDPFTGNVGGPGQMASGGIADGGSTGARLGGGVYNFGALNLTNGEFGRPFLSRHYSTDFSDRWREFQEYLRRNEALRRRTQQSKDGKQEFGSAFAQALSDKRKGAKEAPAFQPYNIPGRAPDPAPSVSYQSRFFGRIADRVVKRPDAVILPRGPKYETPAPPPADTQSSAPPAGSPITGGGQPIGGAGATQGPPDKAPPPNPSPESPMSPTSQGRATGRCRDRNWFFNPDTQMCYPTKTNCEASDTNKATPCVPSQ